MKSITLSPAVLTALCVCAAFGFTAGCDNESVRPVESLPSGSFIDQPIVVKTSDPVLLTRVEGDECVFDLSEAPLVRDGEYNDLLVSYWTVTSCDEDVYVFDSAHRAWEQIGFEIDPGVGLGCRESLTQQHHLLSSRGADARECVDDSAHVRILGIGLMYGGYIPWVQPIKMNPDYFSVPIPARYSDVFNGLAYHGRSLWTSSNWFNKIYNISLTGRILLELDPPSDDPSGMASDGRGLWLADGSDTIFKMDLDGRVLCGFSMDLDSATGLAWGDAKIWVADHGRNVPYRASMIYEVDPGPSCAGGSAVVLNSMETPGGRARGLAWDGAHLLVASDSLYVLTPDGIITDSYDLPVYNVTDIAWDGEGVWILNSGPKDLTSYDPVIARFRLR